MLRNLDRLRHPAFEAVGDNRFHLPAVGDDLDGPLDRVGHLAALGKDRQRVEADPLGADAEFDRRDLIGLQVE